MPFLVTLFSVASITNNDIPVLIQLLLRDYDISSLLIYIHINKIYIA